jgi:hypothetical protein
MEKLCNSHKLCNDILHCFYLQAILFIVMIAVYCIIIIVL